MRLSRFAAAVAILVGAIALDARLDLLSAWAAQRSEAGRARFEEFPSSVGRWDVEAQSLTEREEELLYVDDYLRADFVDSGGGRLKVYVGYYASPDRATQHPPTICYPGAGWQKSYESEWVLQSAGLAGGLQVKATAFERNGQKELVVYWYSMTGYTGANASWQKLARLRSILTGGVLPGASKIQIAVSVETTPEEAKGRLEEFLEEFLPVLDAFVPGKTFDGS